VATRVVMPQAGQDLETGVVRQWLKAVGDPVAKGEPLVEIETEKINLAVESPVEGVVLAILVGNDSETAILSTIGWVGQPGESIPDEG
jgi:pyruvate/2-oxoglutarate dehydrogenase complex dihydrolipoamide acyltransferase (E2) component